MDVSASSDSLGALSQLDGLLQAPVEFMETHLENLYCRNTCHPASGASCIRGIIGVYSGTLTHLTGFPERKHKKVIDRLLSDFIFL